MPDFLVVPLYGMAVEDLNTAKATLAGLGLTALSGQEAADFIASRAAASTTEADSGPHYASYQDFEEFGNEYYGGDQRRQYSAAFRVWGRLRAAAAHYPTRAAVGLAPGYEGLGLSPSQLGHTVKTYLRMVDRSPDGRPVEEIDLRGVCAFLGILLKDGYGFRGSPISGLGVTGYSMLAHFGSVRLELDPPLPLYGATATAKRPATATADHASWRGCEFRSQTFGEIPSMA